MTDLAVPDSPTIPQIVAPPDATEWELLERQAQTLAKSQMLPKDLRGKPHEIVVIALTARELRIPMMQAVNKIHVIEGKPSMSAELMSALILRDGHSIQVVDSTSERAVVGYRRREWPADQQGVFEWTIQDARNAGLLDIWFERWNSTASGKNWKETWTFPGQVQSLDEITPDMLRQLDAPEWALPGKAGPKSKDNWWKYPKAMLWARAISQVARMQFADVLMGVSLTPEELGAEVDPITGEVIDGPVPEEKKAELLARARALPAIHQEQFKAWFAEYQCPPIPKLPVRWLDALETKLAELEQWATIETEVIEEEPASDQEEGEPAEERGEVIEAELVEPEASEPELAEEPGQEAPHGAEAASPSDPPPEDEPGAPGGEEEVSGDVTIESLWALGSVEAIVAEHGMGTLRTAAKANGIAASGTKPEIAERIMEARPFEAA